jgi:hypothetical protein
MKSSKQIKNFTLHKVPAMLIKLNMNIVRARSPIHPHLKKSFFNFFIENGLHKFILSSSESFSLSSHILASISIKFLGEGPNKFL